MLLDAKHDDLTAAKAMSCLSLSDTWFMQGYALEDSARPALAMLPGRVSVVKSAKGPVQLWPRARRGAPP